MKGIVFTELMEVLEQQQGPEFVDDLIESCELPSGGAYTSVGTYDYTEMVTLLKALSTKTGLPIDALLDQFGEHLFSRFHTLYPELFIDIKGPIEFLNSVETIVHIEVLRLYPDAQLPKFTTVSLTENSITLAYESSRNLGHLAMGLIKGCLKHYGKNANLSMEKAPLNPKQLLLTVDLVA